MCDKELVLEALRQIDEAAAKILVRFQSVSQPSDFTDSSTGVDKLDTEKYI